MHGIVKPAAAQVVAHAGGDRQGECLLRGDREAALKEIQARLRCGCGAFDQRHQGGFEPVVEGLQLGKGHAGLIEADQRIIGMAPAADRRGNLALHRHHPLQERRVTGEIVRRAGLGPGGMGAGL